MAEVATDLAKTVQWLKDVEDIKQLKYRYGRYCDGGWKAQGGTHMGPIADLFTEDGIWDARPTMPAAHGREAIRKLFVELQKIPYASHCMTNPIIEIDGDTAKGYWRLVGAGEMPGGNSGALFMNGYEDDYVRTPEGWRIKRSLNISGRIGVIPSGWSEAEGNIAPELAYEDAGSE